MKTTYTAIVKKYYKNVWYSPVDGGRWYVSDDDDWFQNMHKNERIECPKDRISDEDFETLVLMRKL